MQLSTPWWFPRMPRHPIEGAQCGGRGYESGVCALFLGAKLPAMQHRVPGFGAPKWFDEDIGVVS